MKRQRDADRRRGRAPRRRRAPALKKRLSPVFIAVVGKLGVDPGDLADRAVVHQFLGRPHRRQKPCPHRFHREAFAAGRLACDALGIGHGCRKRLLDQHRLAVRDHAQRLLGMQSVGGCDVDRVDVRIARHRVQLRTGARRTEFRLKRLGPLQVARTDAGQPGVGQESKIGGEMPCDAAGSDNPPLKRPGHASLRIVARTTLAECCFDNPNATVPPSIEFARRGAGLR